LEGYSELESSGCEEISGFDKKLRLKILRFNPTIFNIQSKIVSNKEIWENFDKLIEIEVSEFLKKNFNFSTFGEF
jgi:hypothetical protein